MAKGPTITTIASGYYSRTALNTNFTNIDAAFENTFSLDGSTPNAMTGDLDLNGNQVINGVGKFNTLYIDNVLAGNLSTAFTFLGAWVTGTSYSAYDVVTDSGNTYVSLETHTAGSVFSTDLSAAKWSILASKGATGAGTGDMLVANNLSDVANAATSRSNLGLGTTDSPTFANTTATGDVTSAKLRLTSTTDASLSSTDHALQIGATSGANLRIDNNEILASNNGATATLVLNNTGGAVTLGQNGGIDDINLRGVIKHNGVTVGADATVGTVGTYALLEQTTTSTARAAGATLAGSSLIYANAEGNVSGGTPSGTWRLMGAIASGTAGTTNTSVWLRIS